MPGSSLESSALHRKPSGSCRGCRTAGSRTSLSFTPALKVQNSITDMRSPHVQKNLLIH